VCVCVCIYVVRVCVCVHMYVFLSLSLSHTLSFSLSLSPSMRTEGELTDGRNFNYSAQPLLLAEFVLWGLIIVEMGLGVFTSTPPPSSIRLVWWLSRSGFHVMDSILLFFGVVNFVLRAAGLQVCNALQHAAAHCNPLQCPATPCAVCR